MLTDFCLLQAVLRSNDGLVDVTVDQLISMSSADAADGAAHRSAAEGHWAHSKLQWPKCLSTGIKTFSGCLSATVEVECHVCDSVQFSSFIFKSNLFQIGCRTWVGAKALKGRVPPFLHKVVLRRANQPHNSHEDRFSMLWPSRTQSPPKNQITMVKVSGKHIWWHQICLPDTLTIVIWLLGGDCVRLDQSIEKRSSWELWGWFALLKTTLCKKGGTLPLRA